MRNTCRGRVCVHAFVEMSVHVLQVSELYCVIKKKEKNNAREQRNIAQNIETKRVLVVGLFCLLACYKKRERN